MTDEGEERNKQVQGTEKSHDVPAGRRHINTENEGFWMGSLRPEGMEGIGKMGSEGSAQKVSRTRV